jgi:predicted nucleotidyltransferase
MDFKIEKSTNPNLGKFEEDDLKIAIQFTERLHKEFGELLKAVVLFGSAARPEKKIYENDIDVLIVVNDLGVVLSSELSETYKVILERLIKETSLRIHATTLKFTNFWDYCKDGDPVAINMLRDGIPLLDTGFFEPLQKLLFEGRIRPTQEAVWVYFARAPTTLYNSKWHVLQATLDLYWAVIDSAHAALMSQGELPPTPSHVADLLQEKLADHKLIDQKYVGVCRNFYKLSKMIMHREISEVTGQQYDGYYREANEFVEVMRQFIDRKK